MITSDGKSAQTSFDIEVLMNTGINDLTSDFSVEVFPNPTKGNVNIQFTELPQKGTRINILDLAGRLIRTQAANSDKEFIDLQGNKSGVYFIQIKNEQHAKTYKVILE